jgi:hypothetical protein
MVTEGETNLCFASKHPVCSYCLLLGLIAPVYSYAANYCIAVSGGFGSGGTSFIGIGFALPAPGSYIPWSGFTKTGSTVILTTTGTGCVSSNGNILTVSVFNTDPESLGAGQLASDYIQLCAKGPNTRHPFVAKFSDAIW